MVCVLAYISTFLDHIGGKRKQKENPPGLCFGLIFIPPQQHSQIEMALSITNGVCRVCASHSILYLCHHSLSLGGAYGEAWQERLSR